MQELYMILLLLGFGFVFFLYTKNRADRERNQMMEGVKSFTDRMVKENQVFLQQFGEVTSELDIRIKNLDTRLDRLEERLISQETSIHRVGSDHRSQERTVEETTDLIRDVSIDLLHLHDRYQDVFELYRKGITIEEISRRLGFGKGELELILQLAGEK